MNKQANPVLVELTRGGEVESRHRGSLVVVNAKGQVLFSAGNIDCEVFPRSAIKAFQALPLVMHKQFHKTGLKGKHIALACSSHGGEPEHTVAASEMLELGGFTIDDLECGAHIPLHIKSAMQLYASGEPKSALHNNCSGKHSAMLLSAKLHGFEYNGYIKPEHSLQKLTKSTMQDVCQSDLSASPCGCDGCSLPTWGLPLKAMAHGMARLFGGTTDNAAMDEAGRIIGEAAREFPFMIAGTKRFCTNIMREVPRIFAKTGAEGVYCGAIPDAGIGIAVKCDDGASRAAEVVFAASLSIQSDVFSTEELKSISKFCHIKQTNWNGFETGELKVSDNFASYLY